MTVNVVIANTDFGIDHIEVYKTSAYKFKENVDGDFFIDSNGEEYFFYYTRHYDERFSF